MRPARLYVHVHVQISVLDYQSTQLKLLPILATTYCLHFARDHLVRASAG